MNKKSTLAALALVACTPSVALANAGTPLMLASFLHLLLGNFVIGVIEGALLARVFKVNESKAIGRMIVANYVSAWIGYLLPNSTLVASLPINLYNAHRFLWIMVAITYVLTLLIEWPFVALALRGIPNWFPRSVKGSLLIQTATYIPLVLFYSIVSGPSLLSDMNLVPLSQMPLSQEVLLYYISTADGSVKSRSLTDLQDQTIYDLNSHNPEDRLFVQRSSDANTWDLVARLETADYKNPKMVVIRKSFAPTVAYDWRGSAIRNGHDQDSDPPSNEGTSSNFGPTLRLGNAMASPWKFWAGFWPGEGLRATHSKTNTRVQFSWETPFAAWPVRNATHLPNDTVLFQLGDNQICLMDPRTRNLALITPGRGPVAVLKFPLATQPTTFPTTQP